MADAGSFNADLGINMQFNIDGAGLVEMTKTIKEIAKGKDLQRYWKDVESATDSAAKAIERYNKNVDSKRLAENFLKEINALKAITKNENLSELFPDMNVNFDGLIESAKKVAPQINSEFSTSKFEQAFNTFDLLKEKGIELGEVFRQLSDYVNLLKSNMQLSRENDDFRSLIGDADIEKIKEDLREIQTLRFQAEKTFNNFLDLNNIEKTDMWGDDRFPEYFSEIRNGSITATEAIARFKTEYGYLLEESFRSSGNTLGLDHLQAFSTKLDSIFHQVEETSNKINDIISNGVITKSVQNLSENPSLSDSQRSIFGNLSQDEETLKSITTLIQNLIAESNKAKNTEIFNSEQFTKIESLFENIELHLSSIKKVFVDVGDGNEFSPLLSTINKINSSISELSSNVKNIGFNMNIDVGSDTELETKIQSKMSNALQAYQRLFDHIKMSGVGGSMVNTNFFEFDINQFDTMMAKIQAYRKFIENMRNQVKSEFGGKDLLYTETDKKYWTQAASAMGQLTKAQNELNKTADTNPLEDMFGKTDLTEVVNQLSMIVSKLDEISVAANNFSKTFSQGLNVTSSVEDITKLTDRIKELETEVSKLKTVGSSETSISSGTENVLPDTNTSASIELATSALREENKALDQNTQKIKENTNAKEQNANVNLSQYDRRLDSYQGKSDKYSATLAKFQDGGWASDEYIKNVNAVKQALDAYKTTLNGLNSKEGIVSQDEIDNLDKLESKLKQTVTAVQNMSAAEKGFDQLAAQKELDKISKILSENTRMSKEARAKIQIYYDEIASGNPSASLGVIHGKILEIVNAEEQAGRAGKNFIDILKNSGIHKIAADLVGMFSVYDLINLGKQGVSTIIELDDALVDLKKTTAMNSTQLKDFYYDANAVAKQMGVTTEEIIAQASAWSRLGYSSQEAATTMAQLSSKFASISPGMSTDEAQEGLVSIMKAFDIDPDDVETEIMDKVNVLGNKFAEENQDVVEGLKRSAAAMSAMGQSFTDTAALFTGGMEILQDSESMGTALRTLSMRVRGYDEETNQLSNDLVNVTGEVADLTKTAKDSQGVSLFTDATQEHYRSMVEYLGDIADRWDQISEKNQTELLQKLFGKNRANESVCPYVQKCA